jgi:hypothetical protein
MTTNTVRVRMMEPVRFYTRDAAPRSRDAILSPPTREELAANQRRTASMSGLDLGMRWTGDLKPVGEAVARVIDALSRVKDEALQKQALSAAVVALADYGNESSEAHLGPFGSRAFSGNLDADLSGHAEPEDIQRANDRFWSDRLSRPRTQDSAGRGVSTRATAESINEANAAFWSGQPPHRYGGQWGKG